MELTFTLCLPRDETSVPFVRHLCRDTLVRFGVSAACAHEVELGVSEACTNVLRHSTGNDEYEIRVRINAKRCAIEVQDAGPGFDPTAVGVTASSAERGRGIHLMRSVVDDIHFDAKSTGTVVTLVKNLEMDGALE